jgi:hypothetical protein
MYGIYEKYEYEQHLFNVNDSSSSTSSVSKSCQGCTSDLIMLKSQLVKRNSGRFSTLLQSHHRREILK